MAFIEVDSKKIYIEEYGKENKHTIVYFHGGPGENCLDFMGQAKALGEKYHVVSFDQYGCLRSDAIPENESFAVKEHAVLIDKMREKLGIASWTLIGHSYGGMLACLYAYTYPKNVEAVIYECPSLDFILSAKSIASFFIPYFKGINSDEGVDNCAKIINKDYADKKSVFTDMWHVLNLVKDEKERQYLHNISAEELNASYPRQDIPDECRGRGMICFEKIVQSDEFYNDYLPCLKEIKQPSLLLVGKYDPVCCETQRDYFRQFAVNGKIVEFENSGHFPRIEEPHTYTDSIINFLDHAL